MESLIFRPRTVVPTVFPSMLEGENADEFVRRYNSHVDSQYNGNEKLKIFQVKDIEGVRTAGGSSPLALPIVEEVLPAYRIARPEEIFTHVLREGDGIKMRGNNYIDLGILLDFSGSDGEIARDLFEQLPSEMRDLDRLPAIVIGYGVKNFDKGKNGLGFVFGKKSELRTAEIYAKNCSYDLNDGGLFERGIPSKEGSEKRIRAGRQLSHKKENLGVRRLCLYRFLVTISFDGDLAGSGEYGRVVLVGA